MVVSSLTDRQQAALSSVKQHFHLRHHYLDGWISNFLKNKDFNVSETIAKLERRREMERTEFRHYTITEFMTESMRSGVLQLLPGADRDGMPVVYIVTKRDHPKPEQREERRKNLDMWLSYVTRLTPENPSGKVTWLINQKGSSMWANTDLTFQREIMTRISKYFPFCQHRVMVCNMSNGLSFVLKPLIRGAPAAIRDSIVIMSESDVKAGKVMEYIDKATVPLELGGTCDCDHEWNWSRFAAEVSQFTADVMKKAFPRAAPRRHESSGASPTTTNASPSDDGIDADPVVISDMKLFEVKEAFHVNPWTGEPLMVSSVATEPATTTASTDMVMAATTAHQEDVPQEEVPPSTSSGPVPAAVVVHSAATTKWMDAAWQTVATRTRQHHRNNVVFVFWSRLDGVRKETPTVWRLLARSSLNRAEGGAKKKHFGSSAAVTMNEDFHLRHAACHCSCALPCHHIAQLRSKSRQWENLCVELLQLYFRALSPTGGTLAGSRVQQPVVWCPCDVTSLIRMACGCEWTEGSDSTEAPTQCDDAFVRVACQWAARQWTVGNGRSSSGAAGCAKEMLDALHVNSVLGLDALSGLDAAQREWSKGAAQLIRMWLPGVSRDQLLASLKRKAEHHWGSRLVPLLSEYEDRQASVALLQWLLRRWRDSREVNGVLELRDGFQNILFRQLHALLRDRRRLLRRSTLFHVFPCWHIAVDAPAVVPGHSSPPDSHAFRCKDNGGAEAIVSDLLDGLRVVWRLGAHTVAVSAVLWEWLRDLWRPEPCGSKGPFVPQVSSTGERPNVHLAPSASIPSFLLQHVVGADAGGAATEMELVETLQRIHALSHHRDACLDSLREVQHQLMDGRYHAEYFVPRHLESDHVMAALNESASVRRRDADSEPSSPSWVKVEDLLAREWQMLSTVADRLTFPLEELFQALVCQVILLGRVSSGSDESCRDPDPPPCQSPHMSSEATNAILLTSAADVQRQLWAWTSLWDFETGSWGRRMGWGRRVLVSTSNEAMNMAERLPHHRESIVGIPRALLESIHDHAPEVHGALQDVIGTLCTLVGWMNVHDEQQLVDDRDGLGDGENETGGGHCGTGNDTGVSHIAIAARRRYGNVLLVSESFPALEMKADALLKSMAELRTLGLVDNDDDAEVS